jgi:Transcription initiation factor TFIIIB, Brf1 subunit/Transcription initiation factor TFIIB
LWQESSLSTFTSALDIIVEPIDYVPYFARQLKIEHETELLATVRSVLEAVPTGSGTNPSDEASAAFYAVMKEDDDFSITQAKAAEPARCSNLAIRNKYKKYANLL